MSVLICTSFTQVAGGAESYKGKVPGGVQVTTLPEGIDGQAPSRAVAVGVP